MSIRTCMRRPVWSLLSAGLLALLAGGCAQSARDEQTARVETATEATGGDDRATDARTQRAARAVAVTTRVAQPRRVVDQAFLPGSLAPVRRATIAAEVEGRVDRVGVEVGDAATARTLLAEVDTERLEQAVVEAKATQRQRSARLDRAEKLFARRAITQQQLLDATTEAEIAEARLARARLDRGMSRVDAPWTGAVSRRWVEVGDFVKVGDPMFELIDTRRLEARAQAPASDAPFLRVGLEATVRVDGFAEEAIVGQISRLGAELDRASHTLAVTILIDNAAGRFRPGMLVRVALPRQVVERALTVPLAALVELEETRAVFVVDANDEAVRRVVDLGPVVGAEVVVTSGLAVGDRVVVAGQAALSPGQRVHEADRVRETLFSGDDEEAHDS